MAYGEGGRTGGRTRLWAGLLLLGSGCYLLGDFTGRARAALEFTAAWWPFALLVLALGNLIASAVSRASLIAPLLLAGTALAGLALHEGVSRETVRDFTAPGVLALAGAALALSAGRDARPPGLTRAFSTGRVVVPPAQEALLTVRAVVGEMHADLTRTPAGRRVTVHVTVLGGHVRLDVPRGSGVTVNASGTVLTRVSGPEPRDGGDQLAPSAADFDLHLLGVLGAVSIVRV